MPSESVSTEPVDLIRAEPLTARCRTAFLGRVHACLGISPFNSHFSAQRIACLVRWGLATFTDVHFFVPDTAAAHTLEALGYPPERAAWKARRQGQYVRNKITKALADNGVLDPGPYLLDGQALASNPAYEELTAHVEQRFRKDTGFAQACLSASAWVLERRLPPGRQPTQEQLRGAVRYFLAELPLFLDTPRIAGTAASVFCYHEVPQVLADLYHHRLSLHPAPEQGFCHLHSAVEIQRPGVHVPDTVQRR
ncbi:tRNA-dependent cyclodipeptide synthase [Streptomyces sp. NPDC058086]|uniref:tRNA-dependent cyclodipeptide synthase n=1 Tax=Streptomyces sp. NPDC058086 TaxID=3346334 RepID=UPI0036E9ED50